MQSIAPSLPNPHVMGRRLQAARKARGLTQQEVADRIGVARTTLVAIEKGERRVQPDEIVQLASLYGRHRTVYVSPMLTQYEMSFSDYVKTIWNWNRYGMFRCRGSTRPSTALERQMSTQMLRTLLSSSETDSDSVMVRS
jgi:transcriptional regulator with XRE-family HTH domain